MPAWPHHEHRLELDATPHRVLPRVAEAAEMWGAEWSEADAAAGETVSRSGQLALPIIAGLRRGFVRGRLDVAARGDDGTSSELVFGVEESFLEIHRPALVILLFAGLGASTAILWPFYPALLPLVPLGAIMALGAWFLVISKLRTSGPDDFLELVGTLVG